MRLKNMDAMERINKAARGVTKALAKYHAAVMEAKDELDNLAASHAGIQSGSILSDQIYIKMREHSFSLYGRMSLLEISKVIGVELTRGNQADFGRALTALGVKKGKSGSTRYYVFGGQTGYMND